MRIIGVDYDRVMLFSLSSLLVTIVWLITCIIIGDFYSFKIEFIVFTQTQAIYLIYWCVILIRANYVDFGARIVVLSLLYIGIVSEFSATYFFLDIAIPNSFNCPMSGFTSFYFSTITMATVGFGDVYATTTLSRMLVSLQVLEGVFLTAVVFALLAASLSKSSERP